MNEEEKFYAIKIHVMGFISNRIKCFYCNDDNIERLLVHHVSYHHDSVVYKYFGNSFQGRIMYYSTLLSEVMKRPRNFLILCFGCHKFRHGKLIKFQRKRRQESL